MDNDGAGRHPQGDSYHPHPHPAIQQTGSSSSLPSVQLSESYTSLSTSVTEQNISSTIFLSFEEPPSNDSSLDSAAVIANDKGGKNGQKSPRGHVSSSVLAFVTFLKALFGVSLLSSPRVFNETGLLLGSVTYIVIIIACAFACYLLLEARAVVISKQSRMECEHPHIMTYGELGRKLLGGKASVAITFLIVSLHLCFGSGMVAGSIHEFSAAIGLEERRQEGAQHAWWSRLLLPLCFVPIVALLLQFRTLSDLFRICTAGLVVYMVGCVGSMVYVTILNSGEDGPDAPKDKWEWKFAGIPKFVGSTVCAIEGINLALPTANRVDNPEKAVPVVSAVVVSYGILTLSVAWIGYLGGLGGGPGTKHGEGSCQVISYCLDSELVGRIYQLSLSLALLLTLPIILFPSIEMMEIWFDERAIQLKSGRTSSNRTIPDGWNGYVVGSPSFRNSLMNDFETVRQADTEDTEQSRQLLFPRHWRLRVSHALAVCTLAAMEWSFKPFFTLFTGVGLSFAGFMLPCILYIYAKAEQRISTIMMLALAGLTGLGLCNIVLVFFSVFTSHNFIQGKTSPHYEHRNATKL